MLTFTKHAGALAGSQVGVTDCPLERGSNETATPRSCRMADKQALPCEIGGQPQPRLGDRLLVVDLTISMQPSRECCGTRGPTVMPGSTHR